MLLVMTGRVARQWNMVRICMSLLTNFSVVRSPALALASLPLLFGGCPLLGSVGPTTPVAMAAESKSALTYTAARNGLPTSKFFGSHLAVGDINGDGFPDIGAVSNGFPFIDAVSGQADGPYVWKNDGRGNWTDASSGLPREGVCGRGGMDFGDVNRDGKLDVAIADQCKGAFVFFGDGGGRWSTASAGLPSMGCADIAIGDFDHDGCADVALTTVGAPGAVTDATLGRGVRAFTGNCRGTWKESSTGLPQTELGDEVVLADINGDGNLDIAAAYAAGPRVWLGNGRGEWSEASEGLPAPEVHGVYSGLAVGDVDGDGKLDLAVTEPGDVVGDRKHYLSEAYRSRGVDVFLQTPGPRWRLASKEPFPILATGVAFGDLNNDGHTDLVVAGRWDRDLAGGVYGAFPFLGDGTGRWTLADGTGLPATGRERTWSVALTDVDRDGVLDIAAAFGDVIAPTWSGTSKNSDDRPRGIFGAIEVWRGHAEGSGTMVAAKPSHSESVPPPPPPAERVDIDHPDFGDADRVMGDNDVAIIVGVETYQDLPASDYSASDARLVKDYIEALGVRERNIQLLLNERATQSAIKKSIETWLPNRVKQGGRVFVYYSGHGAPHPETGDAYVVPYDGDPSYLPDTGYPLQRMYDKLGALSGQEVTVVLDACFSGAGGRSVLAKGARPLVMMKVSTGLAPNLAVLAATQGTQISTSSPETRHGVLTYYFLKALRDGKKDLAEIYATITPEVEDAAKELNVSQTPSLLPESAKVRGRFRLRN